MNKESADLILFNANVLTMDAPDLRAEMVATRGDRIIWVGGNSDREAFTGKRTRLADCEGKLVVPGFNDAHIHLFALASNLLSIDCSPSAVCSIVEIQGLIASEAKKTPKEDWIRASGYNEFALIEKRHPNRWDLDRAAPAHPVKLDHRTRHACVLNSSALSLAGITRQTPDPPGGLIDRDYETGEPTGILFGMNSYLNDNVIPNRSSEEMSEGMMQANRLLLASGITSVQEATSHNGISQWEYLQKIKKDGKLAPRVTMMFGYDALDQFMGLGLGAGAGDKGLRLGMVKILTDETRGPLNPPQKVLNEMVLSAHTAGFQVALHAVEENTVEAAINAIEYAQKQKPKVDHRHRIEHCAECPPELLRRLKEIGAIVVTQPAFLYYGGDRYLSEVSPQILPWLYRLEAFHNSGIGVAASSDGPVVPLNPLIGIYAAATRKSDSGQTLSPQEAVSVEQALRLYTVGGAYASFEENDKGSISVGKLADLVILSDDPTQIPLEAIKDIRVEKTIIGGEIVWG